MAVTDVKKRPKKAIVESNMTREIKFRAWDGQRMREWGFLKHLQSESIYFSSPPTESGSFDYFQMQFTGLKDKNGVEIYEGDVLKYNAKTKPAKHPYSKVFWREGRSGFCLEVLGKNVHPTDLNPNRPELRGLYQDMLEDKHNGGFHEVIGNIYQNPELLK